MKPEEVGPFVSQLRQTVRDFQELPIPTIAALDGFALGGGLELAMSADLRTASNDAKVGLTETKLAIIPGGGGTQNISRLVGVAKAKELVFTGRMIQGEEAEKIGLVNKSVQQNETGDAAYQAALELAAEIRPQGPIALRMAKLSISKGSEVDLATALAIEQMCYAQENVNQNLYIPTYFLNKLDIISQGYTNQGPIRGTSGFQRETQT